jgi:hypothetical protein
MKKFVIVLFLAAFFPATSLFATGYYTELLGGYTTVSMAKVNSDIITTTTGPNISNTQLGNAWYAGVDAMYIAPEGLGFHFRVEYIGVVPGEITDTNVTNYPFPAQNYQYQDYQISPSMLPLMLGLSYTFHGKGNPFTLTAGVYGGVADAFLDYYEHTITASPDDFEDSYDAMYEGWGFCGEAVVNANYWFTKNFSFGLDFGYRYANISGMTTDSTVYDRYGTFVMDANTPLRGVNGNVNTDFTGLIAGINFTYRFDGWWVRREHAEVIETGW